MENTLNVIAVISFFLMMLIHGVILTWKTGSIMRMIEDKIAQIDKRLSIEIAEIKVLISKEKK